MNKEQIEKLLLENKVPAANIPTMIALFENQQGEYINTYLKYIHPLIDVLDYDYKSIKIDNSRDLKPDEAEAYETILQDLFSS